MKTLVGIISILLWRDAFFVDCFYHFPIKLYGSYHLQSLSMSHSATNKVLNKFYQMVDRFSKYSFEDIKYLENERLKHLIFGGKDALNDPGVLTSFSILYEDILPVRFGGDILFNLLEKTMNSAKKKKLINISNLELKAENKTSTLPSQIQRRIISQMMSYALPEDLTRCDNLFAEIDVDNSGAISFEEFESWVASIELTDAEIKNSLFSEVDVNNDGFISFEEFKMWTTGLQGDECDAYESASIHDLPAVSLKYRERYLKMVQSFGEWGQKFNDDGGAIYSSGRIGLVVKGCFEGAKNPGVVKALGILYEDYMPLRIAGDAIFKIVEARMS